MASKSYTAMREFVLVTSGKLFGLLSLFACGILAARVTGPEEYSIYAAALTLILLLDGMVGSPLDWAMVRFGSLHRDEPVRVERMLGATFRLKLMLALTTGVLAFLFKDPLSRLLFSSNNQSHVITIVVISLIGLLAYRGTAAYLQLHLRFKTYAMLDAVCAFIRLIAVVLLLFAGFKTAEPYIAVYGLSAMLTFMVGLILVRQSYMWAARPSSDDRQAILKFFGATSAIIVLGTISGRADILVLAALTNAEEVGHYAAAAHIAVMITLLASYAGVIAQPRVIQFVKQGRLWALLRPNLIGGIAVSVLAVPVALWIVPWMMPLLFGEAFGPSAAVLQILIIGACLDLFTMPVLQTYAIQLHSRPALVGEIIVASVFLMCAPAAAKNGPVAMAWLVTIVRLIKLCFYTGIAMRYSKSWHQQPTAASTASRQRIKK